MTGQAPKVPSMATLTAYDCWGLLETEEIARVAWATSDGVAIVPVNYTVSDGCLWFRTQPDSSLGRQCREGGHLAVEVDHVDRSSHRAWSVVVNGSASLVSAEDVPDAAMEMRVWPQGLPRTFVRLEPDELTGRRL